MKQEVVGWYTERHYQPSKMIRIFGERHGFSQAQIEAAMIHCYDKIVNEGKPVLDVDVARYVKNVCKDIDFDNRDKELKELYESKEKIDKYQTYAFGLLTIGPLIGLLFLLFYLTWRM